MMDFESLASDVLSRWQNFVPTWLPGGKLVGKNYQCSDITGGNGQSFKVDITTGVWIDFANDSLKGGDLISLYAAIKNMKQIQAARELSEQVGKPIPEYIPAARKQELETTFKLGPAPEGIPAPDMNSYKYGDPTGVWTYRTIDGKPTHYIARYQDGDKKTFMPFSWDLKTQTWVKKALPAPRPLYGLETLMPNMKNDGAQVLIVEGEKACDAARQIISDKATVRVVTWQGGSGSVQSNNWSPIYNRKIVIWPDADEAGMKAAQKLCEILVDHCAEVKLINPIGKSNGWDAADALAEGFTWNKFMEWLGDGRVSVYKKIQPEKFEKPEPVSASVSEAAPEPVAKSGYTTWESVGLDKNGKDNPYINIDNVVRIFEIHQDFKNLVWYDTFLNKYMTSWDSIIPREWTEIDDIKLAAVLQREMKLPKMTSTVVNQAVIMYGQKNKRNQLQEWLTGLKWDGTPRVKNFLHNYMGASNNAYVQAASKNFWVSMVARAMTPGCKVDNMLILEGAQGKRKSTALDAIGGEYFAEAHDAVTNKDFYINLQGKLIIEISELEAFSRAESSTIKKVISCRIDRFRPPFGRTSQDHKRQCIFVGTTNDTAYLKDSTGGRRFWPVRVRDLHIDKIKIDREQLFAEALAMLFSGENWYDMPEQAKVEQESRRQHDEWEVLVGEYLSGPDAPFIITISGIADHLGIEKSRLDSLTQKRIGKCLRILGYENKVTTLDGKTARTWVKRSDDDDY
jgi:putative DNA primase/helicase